MRLVTQFGRFFCLAKIFVVGRYARQKHGAPNPDGHCSVQVFTNRWHISGQQSHVGHCSACNSRTFYGQTVIAVACVCYNIIGPTKVMASICHNYWASGQVTVRLLASSFYRVVKVKVLVHVNVKINCILISLAKMFPYPKIIFSFQPSQNYDIR